MFNQHISSYISLYYRVPFNDSFMIMPSSSSLIPGELFLLINQIIKPIHIQIKIIPTEIPITKSTIQPWDLLIPISRHPFSCYFTFHLFIILQYNLFSIFRSSSPLFISLFSIIFFLFIINNFSDRA